MRTRQQIVWMLLLSCALTAGAQQSVDNSRRNAIMRAVEEAAPAVVAINVVIVETERSPFWDLYERPMPPKQEEHQVDSAGTGFLFDSSGHILTNYHVIEDASEISSITLPDGRRLPVTLVGVDKRTDLAVLHVDKKDLPWAMLGNSDRLMIGEWSIAIGNPLGGLMDDAQPTVSLGVISAIGRRVSRQVSGSDRLYQDLIQTDAAINPGNSGGPLVNADGEVVGINTMIFSPSGGSIGIGFAIPINRAKRVARELIRYGRRRDPWPGFRVLDVHRQTKSYLSNIDATAESGCVVAEIMQTSPAYKAGLRKFDVIVSMNGNRIHTSVDIDFAIWDSFIGDEVVLRVERKGRSTKIQFELSEL